MTVVKHVGFTGTRQGMTAAQRETLEREFRSLDFANALEWWFHHGDCKGSDEEADAMARAFGAGIILHPPVNSSKRAFVGIRMGRDAAMPTRPYLRRNMDIVRASDRLFATPAGPEKMRSGTWSTIRLARNLDKDHVVIMPDGSIVS